jgi:ribose transport system substrate-binding protein
VDLIIIQRSYAGDSSPAVQRARQAGATVVAIDSDVPGGTDALVKPDEEQGGMLAAQYIAHRLAEKGGIVAIANGPANAGPIQLRVEGFIGELKKYPRIKIVENRDTGMSREGTRRVMAQFLADHADLDAVYGVNDPVAYYCELEALAANRTNLFIVGMEGSPTSTKAMKDPQRLIAASPAEDPFAIAETAVKTGAALRQGGPALTSPILVPFTELSRQNIGQYHGWSR